MAQSKDEKNASQAAVAGGPKSLKRLLSILGPGLITGASDDDPSGIGTYAMAGASLGYSTLWMALVTFPLMAGVQLICARIGLVSGCGLAGIMRRRYSRWIVYPAIMALIVANTINAAADIQAIAAGINLLIPVPIVTLTLPIGVLILVVQVWGSYQLLAKIFRWLTLSLFAYIGAAFLAHPKWNEVLKGTVVPTFSFSKAYLSMLVAILGTTISPYLFFWQANQEVEEQMAKQHKRNSKPKTATSSELRIAAWDVNAGMLLSNIVMYFIILATGATLHEAGKTHIDTATQAAEALRPLAGEAAYVLMALGLIGTGVLAVPILTGSAGYSFAEMVGWKCGLDKKPHAAKGFYWIIAAATAVALVIDFVGVNPMDALFWTAVINGFLAPPMLVIVMLIANDRKVMGRRANGLILNFLGWATTAFMAVATIVLMISWASLS
ncbi:MAG TPA: divalent metal cation transporter [Pirellulales bacterium]|jgi:NRAMP (natural resistance-associated macrophage protein)-like metal ion transporter